MAPAGLAAHWAPPPHPTYLHSPKSSLTPCGHRTPLPSNPDNGSPDGNRCALPGWLARVTHP